MIKCILQLMNVISGLMIDESNEAVMAGRNARGHLKE